MLSSPRRPGPLPITVTASRMLGVCVALACLLASVPAASAVGDAPLAVPALATPVGAGAPVAHISRTRACPSIRAVRAHTAAGAHVERALVCLINRVRRRAGLRRLHVNVCLDRLAERHAREMVVHRYFAHNSAGGHSLGQRARAFGYSPRRPGWTVGENLAWGAGPASRARWVVRAWMHSPSHRANILRRSFRHIGVAAVRGIPYGIRGTHRPRTFAVDFGVGGRRC